MQPPSQFGNTLTINLRLQLLCPKRFDNHQGTSVALAENPTEIIP